MTPEETAKIEQRIVDINNTIRELKIEEHALLKKVNVGSLGEDEDEVFIHAIKTMDDIKEDKCKPNTLGDDVDMSRENPGHSEADCGSI